MSRLDTIASRQRTSRVRDVAFAVSLSSVAGAAGAAAPALTARRPRMPRALAREGSEP